MIEKKLIGKSIKKIDWFSSINQALGYLGLSFVIVSFIYGLLGSAHYLALHTEFGSLAYRIFVFFALGWSLLIIFIINEFIRKYLIKRRLIK